MACWKYYENNCFPYNVSFFYHLAWHMLTTWSPFIFVRSMEYAKSSKHCIFNCYFHRFCHVLVWFKQTFSPELLLFLRTGFEEDKNFHVVLNSVIAGRYHVTEYLGSAAFSKAIQAHDLHTGMDVCVKIIKNNKDFFDQSLDEIKLLKYVNKHDPADKYHILRLYDYFYYRVSRCMHCHFD